MAKVEENGHDAEANTQTHTKSSAVNVVVQNGSVWGIPKVYEKCGPEIN